MHDETRLVHRREAAAPFDGLSTPLTRASTVTFPDVASFMRRQERFYDGYTYALYGHPVARELEDRLTSLAHGARSLVVPSGLAAISLVLLTILKGGGHILVPDSVYGPARDVCSQFLPSFGVETTFYDATCGSDIASLLRDETKLIWVESPGSLTMEVQDLPAIARAARGHGCLVAVDNSWASSLLHKPLDLGADLVVEALSKHVGGHSDLILGAATVREEDLFRRLKDTARHLGYGAAPDDCWLALRGLETLGPRLRQQSATALIVAAWLQRHPCVERVLFPALATHPGHTLWQRDFTGASGVFSVLLRPALDDGLCRAIQSLRCFRLGASFGGTASLIAPSDPRKIRTATPWDTTGTLVRLSIGLEHPDDLIADLDQALADPNLMPPPPLAPAVANTPL